MQTAMDSAEEHSEKDGTSAEALSALRRFARPRKPEESCELCGAPLGPEHPHLLNCSSRQIACSCDGCAILFCGQEGAKFLRVPRRVLRLPEIPFDEATWESMMLPIHLAFFVRKATGETHALYPSPAGAMSSQLELPRWDELFAGHSVLLRLEPEVETVLVNRMGDQSRCFVAPVDQCYRLVGMIRMKWKGLSGGPEVWRAVAEFFAELETRATVVEERVHA